MSIIFVFFSVLFNLKLILKNIVQKCYLTRPVYRLLYVAKTKKKEEKKLSNFEKKKKKRLRADSAEL